MVLFPKTLAGNWFRTIPDNCSLRMWPRTSGVIILFREGEDVKDTDKFRSWCLGLKNKLFNNSISNKWNMSILSTTQSHISNSWCFDWHTGLDQGLLSGCSSPASQTGRALPTSSPTRPPPACSRRDSSLQSTSRALTFSKTLGLREMVTTSWSKYKGRVWFDNLCPCCSKCCICSDVSYILKWWLMLHL